MCRSCDRLLGLPEIHIAGPDGDVGDWSHRINLDRTTTHLQGVLRIALIEFEHRVEANDDVRGILLQRAYKSLLGESGVAVISRQLPAEREQAWIIRRQTHSATKKFAQLFPVLCYGRLHVDDLQDVRFTERGVSPDELGFERDRLLEIAP